MFEQALLAGPRTATRSVTFFASMGAQILFLSTAILVPLFLIEGPRVVKLSTMLMAPPPPPPPPTLMKLVEVPKQVATMFQSGRLFAYRRIPTKVAAIVESDLPAPDIGGVQGGVEGGQLGGVIGSVLQQVAERTPAPPPEPKVDKVEKPVERVIPRIRQGGDVQAAKIVRRIMPVYPALARQARVSGTVKLMGIISREGRIMQLQVVSGHPLLVSAAVEAVKQWMYEPTRLNGDPVEVIAPIDVNFTLSQ